MKIVYITKKKMWNIIRLHKRKLLYSLEVNREML